MTTVRITGIPMDLGAGRRGVDMGPSALRLARLAPTLTELGHRVIDTGNVEVSVPETMPSAAVGQLHYPEEIAATCAATAARVGSFPPEDVALALGGDHSVSMGTIAGLRRRAPEARLGVLWVDAHADLNTPASSTSGNVHGMPLAHLLGEGDPRLLAAIGGGAAVAPRDVVYLGLRSVDPAERVRIRDLGITAFTMKDVDQRGIAQVAREALAALAEVTHLHVSFDADVLDPDLAPGVGTPVPGGLSYREAHLLMELLADSRLVGSLDLVEVNPILDVRNRTAAIMVEMAASLLGKKIL